MKIDIFVDIVEGELLNTPFISAFENVRVNPNAVKRGDLFIANDISQVHTAVQNGAYCILLEQDMDIIDAEIAWVKVPNMTNAIRKLTNIEFVDNNNTFVLAGELEFKLLSLMTTDKKNIILLSGNLLDDMQYFFEHKENHIFLSSSEEYIKFFRTTFRLSYSDSLEYSIVQENLLDTSLLYKNETYNHLKIPSIFIDALCKVMDFLDKYKLSYSLQHLSHFEHFQVCFVDNSCELQEYGKSEKLLIFERENSFVQREIEHIFKQAPWLRKLFLLPRNMDIDINDDNTEVIYFENKEQIIEALQSKPFHLAYIAHDKQSILNSLGKKTMQQNLFSISET